MIYTNEEAAMIDGMIGTLFGGANVAENVRDAYQAVRRHLTEDSLDQKDLSRISAAVDFALKNQFCDSGGQLIFLILAHRKVVWLLGFQCIKHQVYGVFELLVILTDFHGVDELNEGGEVLFLHRSLIMDIANKRAVQQGFCFYPEIVSGLAFVE